VVGKLWNFNVLKFSSILIPPNDIFSLVNKRRSAALRGNDLVINCSVKLTYGYRAGFTY
jgi:hypothetical protein